MVNCISIKERKSNAVVNLKLYRIMGIQRMEDRRETQRKQRSDDFAHHVAILRGLDDRSSQDNAGDNAKDSYRFVIPDALFDLMYTAYREDVYVFVHEKSLVIDIAIRFEEPEAIDVSEYIATHQFY